MQGLFDPAVLHVREEVARVYSAFSAACVTLPSCGARSDFEYVLFERSYGCLNPWTPTGLFVQIDKGAKEGAVCIVYEG